LRSPENRSDLFISCEFAVAHRFKAALDSRLLVFAQAIDAGAARLDLARLFGQLLLVLLRPGRHLLQEILRGFVHCG